MSCGFEIEAKQLFLDFIEGLDFDVPDVDLDDPVFHIPPDSDIYKPVKPLTNEDLTTRVIGGDGTFDALMAGFGAHIQGEYKAGRITGAEYTKAYIALTESAMGNATQFLLGRDQAFWAAQLAQIQAITARVQLELAKVQLVNLQLDSEIAKANVALSKGKLATENMTYCTAKFNLEEMLPLQRDLLVKQKDVIDKQIESATLDNTIKTFNLEEMLPKQLSMLDSQIAGLDLDNNIKTFNLESLLPQQLSNLTTEEQSLLKDIAIKTYNLSSMLPQQLSMLVAQEALVKEQKEVQLAQTSNNRTDGLPVTGVLGKQKDLYTQQITSYQRGDEVKAAKLFTDAWVVQKTIDEGLLPPDGFTNASLDPILTTVKANNDLG